MDDTTTTRTIELIKKSSSNPNAKTILIIGVFHGEEPQGEYVINRYLNERDFTNLNNHLNFISCLNHWGKERGVRVNQNGVDLNRNYPTKNWIETDKDENYSGQNPASEIITQQMIDLLEEVKPDIILTLHAPLKCVNYDGPAKELAGKISEFCDYPVIADLGYPTPGSFGTYCGVERNIPTIILEYDDDEFYNSIYTKTKKIFDWLADY
ncbi:M14 family zinc carboxypeptidase [uncultured Draconibacterium sp.]|uniref:M14 family zinc carboxypeptidase n=1 Tax=uncultured Draconibacterium sp. TaxID=1573823 RepID=UPI002AA65329|nr:M14 family zinc carboxypeptidase [uncultured Draconibacterium sp.]